MEDIRSLLFVPADSERKIAKGLQSAADALILDLEDSVMPDKRPAARGLVRETLAAETAKKLVVRINALDTPDALEDLAQVVRGGPYAIMLPKCRSAGDLERLDRYLEMLEAREGLQRGGIRVLPIVTETGDALFGLGSYGATTPRLAGMTWGGEDLAADIGAKSNRDESGRYTPPYEMARTLCLLTATAAKVAPVDSVFTDFRDHQALHAEAAAAARDGFTAKLAIHPDQALVINEVFTPTLAEIEHARRIVAIFEAGAGTSVASLDGLMLDRPHLIQANRLLARASLAG